MIKTPDHVEVATSARGSLRTVASDKVKVSVDTATGAVEFSLADGTELLNNYSTTFTPPRYGDVDSYNVKNTFLLEEDEPVYGVGQLMDGKFNRRNSQHHLQNENMYTYASYFMSPVTEYDAKTWDVYLPDGNDWWDFWTNEHLTGGTTHAKPVTTAILPLYVKAGAIIPFGPDVQYSTEKKWDDLEIRVYLGADGSFTLYEDEFDNYNYEEGKYSEITFTWNDADNTLTISDRDGGYPGMLKNRRFRITKVDGTTEPGHKPASVSRIVSYTGKEKSIVM